MLQGRSGRESNPVARQMMQSQPMGFGEEDQGGIRVRQAEVAADGAVGNLRIAAEMAVPVACQFIQHARQRHVASDQQALAPGGDIL